MTIEISRGQSPYKYQIDPDNPLIIERKLNRHNARWCFYMTTDSPNESKRILLTLERPPAASLPEVGE